MEDSITVITLTKDRTELLQRAIDSVQNQDIRTPIIHLIIIDDCQKTLTYLKKYKESRKIKWVYQKRNNNFKPLPAILAHLRNLGVKYSDSKWISFLDDDNEFERNHLSSLLACAKKTGFQAVHSYRKKYFKDGSPFLEKEWPWQRTKKGRKEKYEKLCKKGVLIPNSNIENNRCDPLGTPDPVRIVDTSEWLIKRSLLLKFPFPLDYIQEDWDNLTTEDDKLLDSFVLNKIPIMSTGLPTLKYYLSGYSNHLNNGKSTDIWKEKNENP
ncbi:MAG: glycosyltransferase family A protein [Promethearchaeota archaeon]